MYIHMQICTLWIWVLAVTTIYIPVIYIFIYPWRMDYIGKEIEENIHKKSPLLYHCISYCNLSTKVNMLILFICDYRKQIKWNIDIHFSSIDMSIYTHNLIKFFIWFHYKTGDKLLVIFIVWKYNYEPKTNSLLFHFH